MCPSVTSAFQDFGKVLMVKPHPLAGKLVDHYSLRVTQAAAELDINRVTLSLVLNGRAGISIDLALRLKA